MSEHELWNELGNLYFMSGAYKQAIHAYERSIQANTDFGRPYSNLALAYVQQGRYDEAIDLYRRSIELLAEDQEKAISWNRLGTVYRHLKDYTKAVIAFQSADELDPHSVDEAPVAVETDQAPAEMPSSVLDQPVVNEPVSMEPVEEPDPIECEPAVPEMEATIVAEAVVPEVIVELAIESLDQPEPTHIEPELSMQEPEETIILEVVDELPVEPVDEPESAIIEPDVCVAQILEAAETPVDGVDEQQTVLMDSETPVAEVVEAPVIGPSFWLEDLEAPVAEAEPTVEELEAAVAEMQPAIAKDQTVAEEMQAPIVETETAIELDADDQHELEWWDFDESRMAAAVEGQPAASLSDDNLNASWTPADPTQFQQDLSQMPETGSLTTWGESDPDDDSESFPPLEFDFDVPDPDGDNLSTWISIPEDAPMETDELAVPPFVEEDAPEEDYPIEWNDLPSYQVISSADIAQSLPPKPAASRDFEYAERTDRFAGQQAGAQQAWDQLDVDVAVEERPAPELSAPAAKLADTVVQQPIPHMIEPEAIAAPTLNALPPDLPDAERDDSEMREIEIGIARFRRVVQVNPRNAHAWDALGTLYKAAGLYKDAILAYQQAISNDSSRSLYYHHLGLVYACEGRDEDAIGAFQRVIEIDPEYSLAHATLGGYYRKLGLEELAQKHIGKAMKSIFDSENEYNKACLEAICGNTTHAIELLGVALKNKQTYVDWILRDPDLDFIRQDPRFKQLISDYTR